MGYSKHWDTIFAFSGVLFWYSSCTQIKQSAAFVQELQLKGHLQSNNNDDNSDNSINDNDEQVTYRKP